MQPGEFVVVLFGGKVPFVMRPVQTEWLFLGESYLREEHILRGRAVMDVRSGSRKGQAETFRIR
jgi:hypothetical protein